MSCTVVQCYIQMEIYILITYINGHLAIPKPMGKVTVQVQSRPLG